jgi:hypothetical protein
LNATHPWGVPRSREDVDEKRALCTTADGGFEILAAEWSGQAGVAGEAESSIDRVSAWPAAKRLISA